MSPLTFAELGLPSELVEVLDRKLITEPFEIQSLAIPDALVGRDILGRAPTGSGKTLAFGLPMLARLGQGDKKLPRGLVLSPTRELAEQICRELEPMAKAMDREVLAVYGGVGLDRQIRALRKGVDVLVACPGRLIDLINQRAVRLDEVDIVVVDEADRMADMGFLPDVRRLLDQTSDDRQTMLFSATLDNDVQILIDKYQNDPAVHEVGEIEPDLSMVDHRFIKIKKTDRIWLAADLIDDAGPTVVFVRTRHGVDRLARQLKNEGIKAGYIHGGRSQSQRDRALRVFIDGKVDALVATDVAARGIHVDGVACVIHYDPPADIKDYVHRSGRTARAGAQGTVVSFLDGPQVKESQKIQRKLALDGDIESPPARRPRSTRPATVDDRDSAAPKRNRGTRGGGSKGGTGGKGGSAASGRSRAERETASNGSKSPSARSGGKPAGGSRNRSAAASGGKPAGGPRNRSAAESDDRPARRSRGGSTAGSGAAADRADGRSAGRGGAKRKPAARADGTPSGRGGPKRKPGSKPTSGTAAKKRSSARPTSGPKRGSGSGSGSDGARSGGRSEGTAKQNGRTRSARVSTEKAAGPDPSSKRSGKPRPKNRKNKPKATGRK